MANDNQKNQDSTVPPSDPSPPSSKRKRTLALVAIGLLLVVGGIFLWENATQPALTPASPECKKAIGTGEGKCAPNFTLPLLQNGQKGEKVSLSNYMGKPSVLVFFGTTCGPCMNLLPVLKDMQAQYKDQINFLYIDMLHEEISIEKAQEALNNQSSPTSPVLITDKDMRSLYPIIGKPTTLFLDPTGRIVHKEVGDMNASLNKNDAMLHLEKELKELLEASPSS